MGQHKKYETPEKRTQYHSVQHSKSITLKNDTMIKHKERHIVLVIHRDLFNPTKKVT